MNSQRLIVPGFFPRGRVGEWLKPADCKSAAPCGLRRFESSPVHHLVAPIGASLRMNPAASDAAGRGANMTLKPNPITGVLGAHKRDDVDVAAQVEFVEQLPGETEF